MTQPATEPLEVISVPATAQVACDGGGGSAGHPLVYLNPGPDGSVPCPYCGRVFVVGKDQGQDQDYDRSVG